MRRRHVKPWQLVTLAVFAGMAVFVGANAHLVLVAISSQPDCVKIEGPHRAAKAAC